MSKHASKYAKMSPEELKAMMDSTMSAIVAEEVAKSNAFKASIAAASHRDAAVWAEIENTIQHMDMTPDELLQWLYKKF